MYRDYKDRAVIVVNMKAIEKRDSLIKEKWKIIKFGDTLTRYEVSNTGIVRNRFSKTPMKQENLTNGYHRVNLMGRKFLVHRLVALAFVKVPKKKYKKGTRLVVNHIDGYKWHNYAYNLEWCTMKENNKHAIETGLKKNIFGELNNFAKMTNAQAIQCCELLADGLSIKETAKIVGVGVRSVAHIKYGESWKLLSKNYDFKIRGCSSTIETKARE